MPFIEANRRPNTDVISIEPQRIDPKETLEALAKLARTTPRPDYRWDNLRPRVSRTVRVLILAFVVVAAATLGWRHFRHTRTAAIPSVATEIAAETQPVATSGLAAAPLPAQATQDTARPSQDGVNASAPTVPSLDREQLEGLARDLAALRQSVEQLEATRRELAKLRQTVEELTS